MEWLAIIKWWIVLEIIGLAAMPLSAWIFRDLNDKGESLTKLIGLLLVTYFSWLLAHLGFDYSTIIVAVSVLMVFSLSLVIFSFKGYPFDRKELVRTELLFTVAFLCFVIFRAYRPEIYFTGGEKFMDMSFINMILHSTSFPPQDPWLSGVPMQYYYFGYLMIAGIIKLSSVAPAIGFNLGVATMFALSATAAYGIGRDLIGDRIFGLVTMVFVVILGNAAGFVQLLVILFLPRYYSQFRVPDADLWTRLSTYNYWPASRVIPKTINEFPYFSFIQGDLHAHMISIAFQLLMIAMLLGLIRTKKVLNLPLLGAIILLLGFMFPLNSWDYPTYAILFMVTLLVWHMRVSAEDKGAAGFMDRLVSLRPAALIRVVGLGAGVGVLSLLLYLPYHLGSSVPHAIKEVTYGQTQLVFYLGVFGIMLFFIIVYSILCLYDLYFPDIRWIAAGLGIGAALAYITHIQILVILLPLIFMSSFNLVREEETGRVLVHILILVGALISLFCELFYIQDSFGIYSPEYIRFNTVFKLYVQNWIMWAIAAGYSLYYLWNRRGPMNESNKGLAVISVLLILAASAYPVFATYSRSNNFQGQPTLDGSAYLMELYPNEYNAIMWLNNLKGTPVVLQSPGHTYKFNTHVSTFTGFPTVLGWAGHEKNWRNRDPTIDERWSQVPLVYTSGNMDTINRILDKYQVDYVYIGGVEVERYGSGAINMLGNNPGRFQLVYSNPNVHIYKVVR